VLEDDGAPSYSVNLCPCNYVLFAWQKEPLQEHWYESADSLNKAVTASFGHLSTYYYYITTEHVPHQWEKCVNL